MADFFNPTKNKLAKQLKQLRFVLFRLIRQEARMRTIERKQDTRRKIQLGGLVKKTGLDALPTATLLGLLLEAADLLQEESAESIKNRWRLKGDIALTFKEGN